MELKNKATITPTDNTYKVETALYPTTLSNAIWMKIIGVKANILRRMENTNAQINTYLQFHNSGRNHLTSKLLSLLSVPRMTFNAIIVFFHSFSNSLISMSCCLPSVSRGSRILITQVTGIVFAACNYFMQELASYNVIHS